jgi:hypothetical protein
MAAGDDWRFRPLACPACGESEFELRVTYKMGVSDESAMLDSWPDLRKRDDFDEEELVCLGCGARPAYELDSDDGGDWVWIRR